MQLVYPKRGGYSVFRVMGKQSKRFLGGLENHEFQGFFFNGKEIVS